MKHLTTAAFVIGAAMTVATPSMAGGLLADIFVRPFSPKAADKADDWHRNVKDHNPAYKSLEEGASRTVRDNFRTLPDRMLFRGIMY